MSDFTKRDLITFEKKIYDLFESGDLPFMMHLSGGNEDQLIDIFKDIKDGDYVLATHRSHYHYLLKSNDPDDLERKLRRGKSMFLFNAKVNFLSTSVLAGLTCVAAGIAFGLKEQNDPRHVWCFLGDGAEDEGHFYEAVRLVTGWGLPCTFVVEDNDRSVVVPNSQRYNDGDFPWPSCVKRYKYTCTWPHAGTGGRMIDFSKAVKPT